MPKNSDTHKIIIDVYKNALEYLSQDIIKNGGKIKSLEDWTYKYLIPNVKNNCPERLFEIKSYAQRQIIKTRNFLNNNKGHSP